MPSSVMIPVPSVAIASICYLVFHRWEPSTLPSLVALLLAPPPFLRLSASSHTSLLSLYVLHFAIIIILTLAYRLSPFHPLAKYPGPRIAAATKLWVALRSRSGKQYLYHQSLHHRYGDIVRTGPNEISFIDPKYIVPMMGTGGMPKGPYWDAHCRGFPARGLVSIRDPVEHSKRRLRWQRGFTAQALQQYELIIEKRAAQLVDSLTKCAGEPLDLMNWIMRFTHDFMMDLTFGGGSEMLRDGDTEGTYGIVERAQPDFLFISHVPWFSEFMLRIPWLQKRVGPFRSLVRRRCAERIKGGSMNRDLMYYLLDEEGIEETPPSLDEIPPDSVVAFLAGSDTIATTLGWLFYLLIKHPDKYQRLREEVDSTTGHAFDTSTNTTMPYLNAVINETLRFFPPTPSGSWRAPDVGSGGYALGEHFIPEGSSTVIHLYTMHRDPRNFSSPDSYLPERWLPSDSPYAINRNNGSKEGFKHNTAAFMPFSYGPTSCLGKQLAMRDMRAVVRLMTEKFTMRFADGYDPSNWEKDVLDYFVVLKGKLPVVLEARDKVQ